MNIWDIATKNIVGVDVAASLVEAQELMTTNKISRVVVFKGTRLAGIITQKDLVRYLYKKMPEEDLPLIPVSGIMSDSLVTLDASKSVEDAAKLMTAKKISSIIITQRNSPQHGIVTKTDLCTFFANNCKGQFKVKDFMSKEIITAGTLQSVITIAEKMTRAGISRVVVVDKDQKPIGIATLSDITFFPSTLPAAGASARKPFRKSQAEAQVMGISSLAIGGIMTHNPIVIGQDTDLAEAALTMSQKNVGGLPVVSNNGKLLGIITKTDVVRALIK